MIQLTDLLANFTSPEYITTNPQSLLWMIPLTASIAIIYKATKLPSIKAANFIKETTLLTASILVVIVLIAIALHIFVWLTTA